MCLCLCGTCGADSALAFASQLAQSELRTRRYTQEEIDEMTRNMTMASLVGSLAFAFPVPACTHAHCGVNSQDEPEPQEYEDDAETGSDESEESNVDLLEDLELFFGEAFSRPGHTAYLDQTDPDFHAEYAQMVKGQ